jgi:hypothetical protein
MRWIPRPSTDRSAHGLRRTNLTESPRAEEHCEALRIPARSRNPFTDSAWFCSTVRELWSTAKARQISGLRLRNPHQGLRVRECSGDVRIPVEKCLFTLCTNTLQYRSIGDVKYTYCAQYGAHQQWGNLSLLVCGAMYIGYLSLRGHNVLQAVVTPRAEVTPAESREQEVGRE